MSRIEEAILKIKARAGAEAPARAERAAPATTRVESTTVAPMPPPAAERPAPGGPRLELDPRQLRTEGLLPPAEDERKLANEFRAIKRVLVGNVSGRSGAPIPNGNLILVTSALPADGKTFSTVNLAFSLALEKDFEVVLVDADVAKPNISRVLGITERPGLLDVLADPQLRLDDVTMPTNVRGLSVISAGTQSDQAVELLTSARTSELLQRAARVPGRLYVFDSTPLLLTNESRSLAELVGQVVLVVRAGSTPQAAVESALDQIPDGRFVGLVLNQRKSLGADQYYDYGYNYPAR
jgi:exopolysaccharide/PEP-CTERM locus tyrosine autokinase